MIMKEYCDWDGNATVMVIVLSDRLSAVLCEQYYNYNVQSLQVIDVNCNQIKLQFLPQKGIVLCLYNWK